ncbi:MAG: alkaline phosphatase [Bacteroidaceae bacterium]|nr:alkaline phosphatase [Bacteroidaceae bacterium]
MIGDGMGMEQFSTAWVANKGKLNIDNCIYTGFQRSYSASDLITDSAASGTALATGEKTYNGAIAVDINGKPLEAITDHARKAGMRTGICTSCRIVDATPAVFSVNNENRDNLEELAASYIDCNLDFIAGGGWHFFKEREDKRDILAEMAANGFNVSTDPASLDKAELPYIGLFASYELNPALDRGDLARKEVAKAIELLNNENGFFLMIEGSCIDDWCHENKIGYVVEEIFDFDRIVGDVLQWAERDGETMVIITNDHSTGGLTLQDGDLSTGTVKVNFSNSGHNSIICPVYAYGPGAENFVGQYENADLSKKISSFIK